MLKKLWKYDIKFSSRIVLLAYLITVSISVFFSLSLFLSQNIKFFSIFTLASFLPYIFSLLAVSLSGFLILIVRVHKNLYSDEGYLTFTLPVTTAQIIWSKVFLYIFWHILGILVFAVSVAIPLLTLAHMQGVDEIFKVVELALDYLGFMARTVLDLDLQSMLLFLAVFVGNFVITLVSTPIAVIFSFTIGQLSNKYKILATLGIYYLLGVVMNTISSLIESAFLVGDYLLVPEANLNFDFSSFISATTSGIVVDIIVTVILFIISRNIMSKKLNLT